MDTATNPTPLSKRIHIDTTAKDPNSSRKDETMHKPSKTLAESFFRSHVASFQPQLTSILEKLGIQHVSLLAKAYNKKSVISRMESDPAFIPHSAYLEFTLNVSKKAEATADFQVQHEEMEKLLQEYQQGLKQQVILAGKIEQQILTKKTFKLTLPRLLELSLKPSSLVNQKKPMWMTKYLD